MTPDEGSESALDAERDRSARIVTMFRAIGGLVSALLQIVLALAGQSDSRAIVPIVCTYALLGSGLFIATRALPAVRRLSWYALPLLDLPTIFVVGYRFIPLADSPVGAANAMLALFLVCLTMAQLSMRPANVLATMAVACILEAALQARAGGPTVVPGSVVSIVVLTLATAVLSFLPRRVRGILANVLRGEQQVRALNTDLSARLVEIESQKLAVEGLNADLRRQIAMRSKQLAETLANVDTVHHAGVVLEPGAQIMDRYRVVRALGQGGMGAVHEVERLRDGMRFALKVLQGSATGEHLSRFAREAQIAAELDHPNVVAVRDFDLTPSGLMFVVMDLVRGDSLEGLRPRFGDPAWALPLLRQVIEGLAALHRAGVIHRDLKPANVMVDENGCAKITDFGIALTDADPTDSLGTPAVGGESSAAHAAPVDPMGPTLARSMPAVDELGATALAATELPVANGDVPVAKSDANVSSWVGAPVRLTRAGAWMGTPLYMAPELAVSATEASAGSDLWAFAVMAVEMLSGVPPFADLPILAVIAGSPPPPPRIDLADSPLTRLLLRCLDPDRARRPTVSEVASLLG